MSPWTYTPVTQYLTDENPPAAVITQTCTNKFDIFILVAFGVPSLLLITLLFFFALRTRKIERKNFKDTKQIIVFIYLFSLLTVTGIAARAVLKSLMLEVVVIIVISISNFISAVLVQVFLMVPKVVPAIYYKIFKKEITYTLPSILNSQRNVPAFKLNQSKSLISTSNTLEEIVDNEP